MSKIKGRYEATITIGFEIERTEKTRPYEAIKNDIVGGVLTKAIQDLIIREINVECDVEVKQTVAEVTEVEHE